jgi:hypothetical protein
MGRGGVHALGHMRARRSRCLTRSDAEPQAWFPLGWERAVIRALGRVVAASALPLVLGGCIATGVIDRRATTVNEEVGETQNRSVLLNLVRASRDEPVYFVALNQIGASGTTDFRASAPQFFLGPNLPAVDKIATFSSGSTFLDNATNSNFQMSLLGSKDFYAGLMAPLSLRDVDLLLHQGYSRELIFYLVIDKATITEIPAKGGPAPLTNRPQVVYNDPANADNFKDFNYYIKEAMEHGLTTETHEAADAAPADDSASGGKPGGKKPGGGAQADLCYDKALATQNDIQDIAPGSFCGDKAGETAGGPLYVTLHDKGFILHDRQLQIDVTTRSIYGIFYYLGRMIRSGQGVELQAFNLPAEKIEASSLLDVTTGGRFGAASPSGCFSAVSYEGQSYCVPLEGADNTKRIFGILNALIALKQSPGDLPITQTVRIQQ